MKKFIISLSALASVALYGADISESVTISTTQDLISEETNIVGTSSTRVTVTIDDGGVFEFDGTTGTVKTDQYSLTLKTNAELYINGGTLDMNTNSISKGGIRLTSASAKIKVDSGELLTTKIAMSAANTTLEINADEAIKTSGTGAKYTYYTAPTSANLVLGAKQSFMMDLRKNTTTTISFTDESAQLKMMNFCVYDGISATIKLDGFEDDMIFISDSNSNLDFALDNNVLTITNTSDSTSQTYSFLKADGTALDTLYLNEVDGGYNLSFTQVPEPAEWAAIFGAIALGLAIYRRRKA